MELDFYGSSKELGSSTYHVALLVTFGASCGDRWDAGIPWLFRGSDVAGAFLSWQANGGVNALKAISAPYGQITWMPTGHVVRSLSLTSM